MASLELLAGRFGETWLNGDRFYHDLCQGKVVAIGGLIADQVEDIHALEDLAKDGVFAIEFRQGRKADVKLAAIGGLGTG